MKEGKKTEWKLSWRDEYLKWICGFANAQGGLLEIGKNNKGKIVGISNSSKLLEALPNKIRDSLGIIPEIDCIKRKGKDIIQIKIKTYSHPVSYKGQYYYRSGSTNQLLRGTALDHFILGKIGKTWDSVPIPKVSVKALSSKVMKQFRKRAVRKKRLPPEVLKEKDELLIKKLKLKEGKYLNRASLLLFHPDPETYVPGAFIKIGYFRDDADLSYHDTIHGDLFTQVDQTMDLLLTKYLKAFITYEGLQRIESYPAPISALREALLNAVIHKDYSSGSPIQIRVYEDKIVFGNICHLIDNWTVKKIVSENLSHANNPLLAKAFFLTGMVETWGRGIEKMKKDCNSYGAPAPILSGTKISFRVQFKNHGHQSVNLDKISKRAIKRITGNDKTKTQKITEKMTLKTTQKMTLKNDLQKPTKNIKKMTLKTTQKMTLKNTSKMTLKLFKFLIKNPDLTIPELAIKISKSESTIKRKLRKLQQEGYLKRIGAKKGGFWKIIKNKKGT